jgi:hydroxyacylglutathione hydrolase
MRTLITPVRILRDNYVWLLAGDASPRVAVVDPGEAEPVLEHLSRNDQTVEAIVITHHHGDHVAGVGPLVERFGCPVYGPPISGIVDHAVGDGNDVAIGDASGPLRVVSVPGHTLDHVAYLGRGFVLCGDTLFAGGCGRLFEGTPDMMLESLDRLAALPDDTRIVCAHEYTEANLRFAAAVEPENAAIAERQASVRALRSEGRPSVPSTLAVERVTNPFLRTREPAVMAAAARRSGHATAAGAETFAAIRAWKDRFR